MTRLAKELAGLGTMSPVQLRERWAAGGADVAPAVPPSLLRRLLAQRLQEKRHGGLPLLMARELDRVAATAGSPAAPQKQQPKVSLTAGTRLIREWNGQTIAVEVTDAGFVWNDRTYRSLTEITREVTGVHWSGPRFFGLKRRG